MSDPEPAGLELGDETLAQQVAAFAVAHPYEALPDAVVDSVRKRVLDTVGIAVAATALPTSAGADAFAAEQGGVPQATAIGHDGRMPAGWAAFVNGVLAHSLDYDDTHLPSVLHPSATVVPASLAAAEANGSSGRELIAAVACGLEVCVRLGMAGYDRASGASLFFEHGQHATSICGAMGAVVSVGLLSGFGPDEIVHALGLAASMSSGIIEANRTGGTVKRMHCGWAAHAAVSAAQLVRHGFTGPPTVLEGRFGFFRAWLHGSFDAAAVTEGLGERWEVPGIFFKPYPANHFTHTAIDAARAISSRGVDLAAVTSVVLGVPAPIVHTIGEPIEVKRRPETGYMAQFSGPYAVVAGLLGGGGLAVGLDDYTDELARDPYRRRLMALVDVVADDRCTAVFPYQFPAVLRVELRDGQELEQAVMVNRGGPQRPLTYDELATKFADNAARVVPAAVVEATRDLIGTLEQLDDVSILLGPLGVAMANHSMSKEGR
jgi:2-methylcitrate dehydratase PrpD